MSTQKGDEGTVRLEAVKDIFGVPADVQVVIVDGVVDEVIISTEEGEDGKGGESYVVRAMGSYQNGLKVLRVVGPPKKDAWVVTAQREDGGSRGEMVFEEKAAERLANEWRNSLDLVAESVAVAKEQVVVDEDGKPITVGWEPNETQF